MATTLKSATTSPPDSASLAVQVVGRANAAREAVTLWLAKPGTRRAPAPYLAGQFTTLALPSRLGTCYRSYSLCGDGDPSRPWEITVKRQSEGLVSPYLCDTVAPGMVLRASAPAGTFVLPQPLRPDVPLILVATGSGITSVIALLRALARRGPVERPPVQLHYAYHSPADAIYARELATLDPARDWLWQWHYVSSSGHRLTSARLLDAVGTVAPIAHWYLCGAPSLKADLEARLTRHGIAPAQIHSETFRSPRLPAATARGPVARQGASAEAGVRVRLAESGVMLATQPNETLLETLERHGYPQPFSCRAGACGTCRLKLLAGQVRTSGGESLSPHERAAGYVLSCVSEPVGDVVLGEVSASPASTRGGQHAARPAVRHPHRTAVRGTLMAASLVLFLGAGRLVTQATTAQAAGGADAPTFQQSSASGGGGTTTGVGGSHHDDDEHDGQHDHEGDDDSASQNSSGSSTPTPSASPPSSGASSITTGPSQPPAPTTSSGVS